MSNWLEILENPWSKRRKHQAVELNDKLLILGGFDGENAFDLNDVWSWDGYSWTLLTEHARWSGRDGHCAVVHDGVIFILGGTDDPYFCKKDVWKSTDGVSWDLVCEFAPWPERWQHAACVHDGRIYIAGGWGDRYLNDVWSSFDGLHWIQVTKNAPWKPRMFHSAISFNDTIYIIGGHDGHMQLRDVWASSDGGLTWTQVCHVAQWEGRQGHASITLADHVYIMGGFGGSTRFNDIWRSKDCAHWTLVDSDCTWSKRQGHACIAFRGAIFILGGFDESGYRNDMYCLPVTSSIDELRIDRMRLKISNETSTMAIDSHAFQKSATVSNGASSKIVTVTNICILESIQQLRSYRIQQEKLIRGILSVISFVAQTLNVGTLSVHDDDAANSVKFDETDGTYRDLKRHRSDRIAEETAQIDHSPRNYALSSFSMNIHLTRRGSPLREALLDFDKASSRGDMPREGSEADFRMHFWRMLSASSDLNLKQRASSNEIASNTADSTMNKATDSANETNICEDYSLESYVEQSSSPRKAGAQESSASLREAMETGKRTLSSIQRQIRKAAEGGDDTSIQTLIDQRTELMNSSYYSASLLMKHVIQVKQWQEKRQKILTQILTRLERLDISKFIPELDHSDIEASNDSTKKVSSPSERSLHGFRSSQPPLNLVNEPLEVRNTMEVYFGNEYAGDQISGSGAMSSSPRMTHPHAMEAEPLTDQMQRTTWSEWESVVAQCAKCISIVNSDAAESAIYSLRESFNKLSKISTNLATFINYGNSDSLLHASAGPVDLTIKSSMNTTSDGIEYDATLKSSASSNDDYNANISNSLSISMDSDLQLNDIPTSLNAVEVAPYENVAQDYDQALQDIDCRKMEAKLAIDREIATIKAWFPEAIVSFHTSLTKGCGLVKSMMDHARLDHMEIVEMEREVRDWNELVNRLRDRYALQQRCDELVHENSIKEENLLKLEDEKIDIRSLLEKATLKETRKARNFSIRGLSRTSSHSTTDDSATITSGETIIETEVEEIRKKLLATEKAVKECRKEMRGWYREVRQFAQTIAPELFLLLPDLLYAGSILGDGGFAEGAKLPKRRLDEYEDIVPLHHMPTSKVQSNSTMIQSRHVLLKATYDGEDVVLKGFIMHEGDQRKGLERELSILSRLRNDAIICPNAIVEDTGTFDSPYLQVAVYIEYPFLKGGNLSQWLKGGSEQSNQNSVEKSNSSVATSRKPWELQNIARQILYGLMYLHDHGVIHKDIKPSNVLMHEDGRVVLTDFELSREVKAANEKIKTEDTNDDISIPSRSGTRGFMAPEVEAGQLALTASDMYSYGVLLLYMHNPQAALNLIPGNVVLSSTLDPELVDLISRLLAVSPAMRPSAAQALMHPYFRTTFVERLVEEGEVVEQNRKLEAVRSLLHQARTENRTKIDRTTIRRNMVVKDVLTHFLQISLDVMKSSLRVIFVGEVGVDEGGLLTEMFSIFFEGIFNGDEGLFCGPNETEKSTDENLTAAEDSNDMVDRDNLIDRSDSEVKTTTRVVLPCGFEINSPEAMDKLGQLRAFGRIMVKALYEGRRIGGRLSPFVFKFLTDTPPDMRDLQMFDPQTARSLQWILATVGVEDFGLHFESVNEPNLGPVTDANKAKFVRLKINRIMIDMRLQQLQAIKLGFTEALKALSEQAAPFMSLLSHTDWRVLLCGETLINAAQVISSLKFTGFTKKSLIPQWLKEILLSSSEDHLRQFLVFVTGSPSMSTSSSGNKIEINVRCQPRSGALPIAHTCFYHLDIPDYSSKDILKSKLIYAIQNATSFEIV